MKLSDARPWVRYWAAAKMVNVDEISTLADAREAIRFCKCMRVGIAHALTPETLLRAVVTEFPRT